MWLHYCCCVHWWCTGLFAHWHLLQYFFPLTFLEHNFVYLGQSVQSKIICTSAVSWSHCTGLSVLVLVRQRSYLYQSTMPCSPKANHSLVFPLWSNGALHVHALNLSNITIWLCKISTAVIIPISLRGTLVIGPTFIGFGVKLCLAWSAN